MGEGGSVCILLVHRCAAVGGAAMATVTTAMKQNVITLRMYSKVVSSQQFHNSSVNGNTPVSMATVSIAMPTYLLQHKYNRH